MVALGSLACLCGAVGVFVSRRARGRLLGVAVMATGALVVLLSLAPHQPAAAPATVVSALALAGLLLVARQLERVGRRAGAGGDLDLDEDPARGRAR